MSGGGDWLAVAWSTLMGTISSRAVRTTVAAVEVVAAAKVAATVMAAIPLTKVGAELEVMAVVPPC